MVRASVKTNRPVPQSSTRVATGSSSVDRGAARLEWALLPVNREIDKGLGHYFLVQAPPVSLVQLTPLRRRPTARLGWGGRRDRWRGEDLWCAG